MVFAFAHHHFLQPHNPYFFKCFRSAYCHALCASDVFHSFVPHSLQTHFTTCACTVYGRLCPLRGESGGGHSPFVGARLVPRQAPPHPHTPGAGARLTPRSVFHREVCAGSKCVEIQVCIYLARQGKCSFLIGAQQLPCIIFLKVK